MGTFPFPPISLALRPSHESPLTHHPRLSPGLHPACTSHVPGFGPLWPGLHPSSFILHPSLRGRIEVALGWLWGGFRVAKGWLVGGYVHHAYTIRTISVHQPYTMSTGSWVAFGWLQISLSPRFQPFLPSSFYILPSPRGGFGRFGGRCPPFLHSSFFILPSPQCGFGRFGVVAISAFPSSVARLRRVDCFPGFCSSFTATQPGFSSRCRLAAERARGSC